MKRFFLLSCFCGLTGSLAQDNWYRFSWHVLNALDRGSVTTLASGDDVLISATNQTGILRSLDTGRTWLPFPVDVPYGASVIYDPTSNLFYSMVHSGIYTAAPRAEGWTRLVEGGASRISVQGKTLVFAGWGEHPVSVSKDGGRTWKTASDGLQHNILSVLATDSCVYAGVPDSAIAVSCDGGATWKRSGSGTLSNYAYGMVHHGGAVIAAAGSGLIRTTDNGKSWSPWAGNLEGENRITGITKLGSSLYAKEYDTALYRSQDGGASWTRLATPISAGLSAGTPSGVAEAGGRLFAATSRGLMSSLDTGRSWSNLPLGLGQAPILSLGVRGRKFVAHTEMGVFSSSDSGATWQPSLTGDKNNPLTAFAGAGPFYAVGAQDGSVAVSPDAGTTWNRTLPGPGQVPVLSLAILDTGIYATTSGGLWRRSVPNGAWSNVELPASDRPRLLAAGKASLLVGADAHIWELSRDGDFSDRSAGIQPFQVKNFWIVEDRLYAALRDGTLHQWIAEDSAWRRLQTITGFVYSLAGTGPYMAAATSEGIYVLEERVKRWAQLPPDLVADRGIRTLTCSGNRIYGGDAAGGVLAMAWRIPDAPTGISSQGGVGPKRFRAKGPRGILKEKNARVDGRRMPSSL